MYYEKYNFSQGNFIVTPNTRITMKSLAKRDAISSSEQISIMLLIFWPSAEPRRKRSAHKNVHQSLWQQRLYSGIQLLRAASYSVAAHSAVVHDASCDSHDDDDDYMTSKNGQVHYDITPYLLQVMTQSQRLLQPCWLLSRIIPLPSFPPLHYYGAPFSSPAFWRSRVFHSCVFSPPPMFLRAFLDFVIIPLRGRRGCA